MFRPSKIGVAFGVIVGLAIASPLAWAGTIQTQGGNFGNVRIGTVGLEVVTAFRTGNASGGALSGTFPSASGLFGPGTTLGFGPIASNGASNGATRSYTFTPTAHGLVTQNLTVTSNLGSEQLKLSGTGVGPVYSSTPTPGSTIDFGKVSFGETATLPFSISNITTDLGGVSDPLTDLTILNYTITGADAGDFALLGLVPGTVIHADDPALALLVAFSPTVPSGPKSAILTIFTDEGAALGGVGSSFTYTLFGTAIPEPTSMTVFGLTLFAGAFMEWRRRRQIT